MIHMKSKPIKNTIKLLITGILLSFVVSCSEEIVIIEEEDRTELDSLDVEISVITDDLTAAKTAKNALQRKLDSLTTALGVANNPTGLNADVHYTVQVTDGSQGYMNGRMASLTGAVVTVSQGNLQQEVTTDDTGLATFSELESGYISVTVEITGFSDVYMIVDLRDGGSDSNGTNADSRYASTEAMVFPTQGSDMFTISGTSYYEQNLLNQRLGTQNDPAHPFTGLNIYETVPAGVDFLIDCTPSTIPNNTSRPGQIISVVYAGLSRVGTTDSNGDWTIAVPVVFLTSGANFFNYSGPKLGDTFPDTQVSATGDSEEIWYPVLFYPNSLNEILFFPGGNSIQDLYYFTI